MGDIAASKTGRIGQVSAFVDGREAGSKIFF
jgi:hypothetical protein